ncbi:hypothetical protein [Vibrio navarrensis]|uniref:hypothetical protein n=1 Tax=Vibrio navarrensis TaxID=29495 RepID=UPI0015589D84|nr:hypothetical protein [Vibrio navarrensis]
MGRLLILILSLFVSLQVQADEQIKVHQVAEKYFSAVKSYDVSVLADMLHPEALSKFRAAFDGAFGGSNSEQAQKDLLPLFSVSGVKEFNSLTDVDAYKRMTAFFAKAEPNLLETMKSSTFSIANVSVDGDVAYVNYSMTMKINGRPLSQDSVQKFKLFNDNWLALLPPSGEATIMNINTRYK